jgi:hypothetical protein
MGRVPNGDATLSGRSAKGSAASAARRKGKPSGPTHPVTSEREYTCDELEFLMAVQAHKERTHDPFPSLTELLRILKSLGYVK